MHREVTLQLPAEVFDEAASLAGLSGFEVDEFMAKLIKGILRPSQSTQQSRAFIRRLFALLADDEILQLAGMKMDEDRLELFRLLLAAQKEEDISAADAADLEKLGRFYDKINLVKSFAMVEAVRRKLMPPPELS
ncbi:MAG: hypothetical protein DKINENOH_03890 [bacterium]|nr:hypothetical protein [bacterium]